MQDSRDLSGEDVVAMVLDGKTFADATVAGDGGCAFYLFIRAHQTSINLRSAGCAFYLFIRAPRT